MLLNKNYIILLLLITVGLLHSQTTDIKKIDKNGLAQIEAMSNDTEELYLFKTYIERLEGLNNLPNLKTVVLEKTAFFETDYLCLSELSQLETLVLIDVEITDTSFLTNLTNLKALILQGVIIDPYNENFKLPNKLDYLEVSNSRLKKLPAFYEGDMEIDEINLSYNNITHNNLKSEDISLLSSFNAVILTGNPVLKNLADQSLKNIKIYSDPKNLLNKKYRKYLR